MNDVNVDRNWRPGSPEEAAIAFALVESEMAALDGSKLVRISVDIPRAVITALGALPAIMRLRPRIVEELPRFPLASIDKLKTYALGAWYAHLLTLSPSAQTTSIIDEASPLRSRLLVAAEALSHGGLIDPKMVAQIRSGRGHIDTANDLVALSALFTNKWDAIEGKTIVTLAEVERAAQLGPELLVMLGARERTPSPSPSQAADQRRRAFTLLVRAYDECRRAISYLRWSEGDVNEVAPSLYGSRGKSKKAGAASELSDASDVVESPESECP